MSAAGELTDALIAGGLTPSQAAALLGRAVAEIMTPMRSAGAIRTERWREKKASQSVTKRHSVTPENQPSESSPTVTERHKASQCDNASLSKKEKIEEIEVKRERRAEQLRDGWRPDAGDWSFAVDLLCEQPAEEELKKFADHALTKGRTAKNWNAAWRNWVRRAVEYGRGKNGHGTNGNRSYPASGAGQSGTDAILAGVAAAVNRRARERGQGGEPADASRDSGRADAKLI